MPTGTNGQKRSSDMIGNAAHVMQIASKKTRYMTKVSAGNFYAGTKTLIKSRSPQQWTEIAKWANSARWA